MRGYNSIKIKRSRSADSRTAEYLPSLNEVINATIQHQNDVREALQWLQHKLYNIGLRHDYSKLYNMTEFYDSYVKSYEDKNYTFCKDKWYSEIHSKERHNLQDYPPDDINLLDVLEYIADRVMGDLGRWGRYKEYKLSPELLTKAYNNTIELLKNNSEVEE